MVDEQLKATLLGSLDHLLKKPSGWLFLFGASMSGASIVYIFHFHSEQLVFAYVTLGGGIFCTILSMAMMVYGKHMLQKEKLEIMKLDREIRAERMAKGELDRTIYNWKEFE